MLCVSMCLLLIQPETTKSLMFVCSRRANWIASKQTYRDLRFNPISKKYYSFIFALKSKQNFGYSNNYYLILKIVYLSVPCKRKLNIFLEDLIKHWNLPNPVLPFILQSISRKIEIISELNKEKVYINVDPVAGCFPVEDSEMCLFVSCKNKKGMP